MKLIPAFQPIVDVTTHPATPSRYPAGEVLARWYDNGQVFGPFQNPGVDWAKTDIEMAQQILRSIDVCSLFFAVITINVSEATLESDLAFNRWVDVVQAIARRRTLRLIVEITETVSEPVLIRRWPQLSRIGAAIALDDYGDACSTLERLMARNWDYCKFSAKRLAGADGLDAVALCVETGIRGIVEQVEDRTYSILSQELGLSLQQGYYHARPAFLPDHLARLRAENEQIEKTNEDYPQIHLRAVR